MNYTPILQAARKYYLVTAVIVVIILGVVLSLTGFGNIAGWLISAFSLLVAAQLAWGMVQTLREGRYGVDILAVTAIVSTIVVGEYWATIVIVLMLTGGEALEDYADGRARRELSALLDRAPQQAHRRAKDGTISDIAVTEVAIGDVLLVKPGEVVPVDAVLQENAASFDESSLTGESLPVEHAVGDDLLSGSITAERAVVIKATRTAHDSQYQQIIELVKAASSTEAPFVRLTDRYAVPFTIVSFVIAGVAWFISGEALRFAEVLVVATPCPLLLGAPIALISGMSRAAKHGIIIKNGATLEKLARIRTVAFDKTGTLTHGEPVVDHIVAEKGNTEDDVLRYAAAAEQHSAHILARAVVATAKERKLSLAAAKDFYEIVAQGVGATVDGKHILVGKLTYLQENGLSLAEQTSGSGKTAVYVAVDNIFVGSISFADQIRENSKKTLAQLPKLGVSHTLMLTGDAQATADRIAKELGITDVKAECLPADKVKAVKALTDRPVLMVGDGVNDAPVLAAAEVGMAMGARGSTAASETADVVVLLDDISKSAQAIHISRDTIRIALQSIWIGIAVSVGLMLVATTGLIPAVVGAALQEVVDVIVIINALRAHGAWRPAAAKQAVIH